MRWRWLFGLTILYGGHALAKPIGPQVFCEVYSEAPSCQGGLARCETCHTIAPERNPFGASLSALILPGEPRPLSDDQYTAGLRAALTSVEALDADGDGINNIQEIRAGTLPGNSESLPRVSGCPPFERNPHYDVCFFDPKFVFRKISLDFCGLSPTFEDFELFSSLSEEAQLATLSDTLDLCLDTPHWLGQDGVLWKIAHKKIRPLKAIKAGTDRGVIPLADYFDDYNLFVYTQTDDRDARDVLTAKYFVRKTAATTYQPVNSLLPNQFLEASRRAGMLTTKWNMVYHVMFTPIPRTAAAQAYRAYLGLDIAKQDGLHPVPGEPVDYDAKGVTAPTCAVCHSTLDPLTYPFTRYHGLTNSLFGSYDANRMDQFRGDAPRMSETPEKGVIFGTEVDDLVQWAEVAANSDEFARATVAEYWTLLVGSAPEVGDLEFQKLWRDFRTTHNYRVERMLHDLVRTEAYGVP